jgi:hypothetical protein
MTSPRRPILCLVLLIPLGSLVLSCAKRMPAGRAAPPLRRARHDRSGGRAAASADRKVIRTAELALQNSLARAADESRAIAEQFGGYRELECK